MIQDFLSLIFPSCCLACNEVLYKRETCLCTRCRYNLPKTNYHLDNENPLYKRFWGKVPISYAFSYLKLTKESSVQDIVYKIKYKGMKEGAKAMGRWYGTELCESEMQKKFDVIVSIPMHRRKLKIRGYNQSELFAEGLSSSMGINFNPNILFREIENSSQTLKSRFDRWLNVNEIYLVKDNSQIKNKHVLLVDDVVTTGATFEVCAKELLSKGAKEVSIVAIACAQ